MSRLAPFLLASAALHAALLAGGAANQSLSAGAEVEQIAVLLDGNHTLAPLHSSLPARQHRNSATEQAASTTDPAMTAAHADAALTIAGTEQISQADHDNNAARVQAQVLRELTRYFYYPSLARRQGWEGRVLLAFHVAQDGQLRDPRVVRTSGFGILDDAALNSLRKVERVADAGGAPLDMQIPVIYRLMDAY